nr:FAD-binding oxidoreductase [Arenicellales bacterium]
MIHTDTVVSAIGPWTRTLTNPLDIKLPLEISRHIVLTFRGDESYPMQIPIVKDLTTQNKMYFRPSTGGVALVGTGDHGDPVDEADNLDENVSADFVVHQGRQIGRRMSKFEHASLADSWVGPYDITPDWNPVLGPVPGLEGLHLAFGFSGHGFKLSPAVGMCLAQNVLGQTPLESLYPYRLSRFEEGDLLTGSYGVGSIS